MLIIFNREDNDYITLTRIKNLFLIPPCYNQLVLLVNTVTEYIIMLEKQPWAKSSPTIC